MKRVVVISDAHCGHRAGLTPPGWQYDASCQDEDRRKFGEMQSAVWDWFAAEISALRPIDVLLCNGDMVDGKGERSGGTEQLEHDMQKQAAMAAEVIGSIGAREVVMTYGTPYHTGCDTDWEELVAEKVGARSIGSHEWVDINGLVLDLKHFTSSSVIPHGRLTSVMRDMLWNMLWARSGKQPDAHVVIRSHVHYHRFAGEPGKLAIITPAMQSYGSKFGSRRCSGLVDIGFLSFDIEDRSNWTWKAHILEADFLAVSALQL